MAASTALRFSEVGHQRKEGLRSPHSSESFVRGGGTEDQEFVGAPVGFSGAALRHARPSERRQ